MKYVIAMFSLIAGISAVSTQAADNNNSATGSDTRAGNMPSREQTGATDPGINAGEVRAENQQQSQREMVKPTWQAHSLMSRTYLQAAHDFMDGLDKQASNEGDMKAPEVKEHARLYGRESLDNLQRAKRHLKELSVSLSKDARTMKDEDRRKNLQAAQRDVDTAIRQDQRLLDRLSDNNFIRNKDAMKEQIAQVMGTIKDAMSNQKSLFSGGSNVGEM